MSLLCIVVILKFGTSVSPAQPLANPPAAPAVYVVFYEYGRTPQILEESKLVIKLAADKWRMTKPDHIDVIGHSDLSLSRYEGQLISERTANAVADALSRYNIPRDQMRVSGRGWDEPLVPTPPGVREPQNRRVEILFQ
jgi:OOP family OmpA-OmpF porin